MSGLEEVNDKEYREAIWKVHNYLCMLCERPLDFAEMEIDHVVPESWERLPESDRAANLVSIGLPTDFKILSRLNHAPLHGRCNNRKRSTPYPMGVTAIYLNQISSKQLALEKELAQLVSGRTLTIVLNSIRNSVDKSRFSLDDLADALIEKGLWSAGTKAKPLGPVAVSTPAMNLSFANEALKDQILGDANFTGAVVNDLLSGKAEAHKVMAHGIALYEIRLKNDRRLIYQVSGNVIKILRLAKRARAQDEQRPTDGAPDSL